MMHGSLISRDTFICDFLWSQPFHPFAHKHAWIMMGMSFWKGHARKSKHMNKISYHSNPVMEMGSDRWIIKSSFCRLMAGSHAHQINSYLFIWQQPTDLHHKCFHSTRLMGKILVRALITNLVFMICLFRAPLYRSSTSEDELWMPIKGKARLRNIKAESSEHKKYYKQHSKKSPVLFIARDILSAFMFLFFQRRSRLRLLLVLVPTSLPSELTICL